MATIHGDFETRSILDLAEVGTDLYASHPSTEPLCFSYAIDDEPPQIWTPGEPFPDDITEAARAGGRFVAHNAAFEMAIWNEIMAPRFGWPGLAIEHVRCTMAMCYAMALPGGLDRAAAALKLTTRKDAAGGRMAMQCARPRAIAPDGSPIWWDDPVRLGQVYRYCIQDVNVERELYKHLMALSIVEQQTWRLDQAINKRGVYIDLPLVHRAIEVIAIEQEELRDEINRLTGGYVSSATEVQRLMTWVGMNGFPMENLQKATVAEAIGSEETPEKVRRPLEIRQDSAKTSTAKLSAMLRTVGKDSRIRDTAQYHAASTGRWGGRRVQVQNLPRPMIEQPEIEDVLDNILPKGTPAEAHAAIKLCYGSPLKVLSSCLRGIFRAAPGHDLIAADFANIEGRVLAWLAGERWKLDAFRAYDNKEGPDLYKLSYAKAFGKPVDSVTKDQRFIGKVMELALGYQGGVGAFKAMAAGYGQKTTDEDAETIKDAWRSAHPKTVSFWRDIESSALSAVLSPGTKTGVEREGRRITFLVRGSFLWCQLPSGRVLCYPFPSVKPRLMPWGEERQQTHFYGVDAETSQWMQQSTYGGKLTENVVQAISRDVLVAAMHRLTAGGYDIVLHVHDEVVAEIPQDATADTLKDFERTMAQNPTWAEGLPIAVEGWRGERYRK